MASQYIKLSIIVLLITILLYPTMISAEKLKVGMDISVYKAEGVDNVTYMVEATATYTINDYLHAVGTIGWTEYESGDEKVVETPITLDGEYHPLGSSKLDPYVGAGLGYFRKTVGDDDMSSFGCQALAGVRWTIKGEFGVSFEVKYRIPDFSKPSEGGVTMNGGVMGQLELEY